MNQDHCTRIAGELGFSVSHVEAVARLIEDGSTVPFIARYRKEATGSMDEVGITAVRDRLEQLAELDKRREAIVKSLEERDLLTDELSAAVNAAESLTELEDIYLPYRPKRRTRAAMAREKGLEPLADMLVTGPPIDAEKEAEAFIDDEKGVDSVDTALAGARDIIAERINEDAKVRERLRELFHRSAMIRSTVVKAKQEEAAKFRDYFDWEEDAGKASGHRILAMMRGEREGFLSVQVRPPESDAIGIVQRLWVTPDTSAAEQVTKAAEDSYKRLLAPSLETELRNELRRRADAEAIGVFASNLRELLLAPPLGRKRVMALDPGFRTGAKLVCLDETGTLLHNDTVYPTHGGKAAEAAGRTIPELVEKHGIEVIAIGNGTASRETESFVKSLDLPSNPVIVMVDESGASVYSASETAREEFPDYDATVRGAVSIGRRLADPLAELVKIDPKSIGVGQYQHDVDQTELKRCLDDVVRSCVNAVGVELNTASKELLSYVSGLGPVLARNLVEHRTAHGPFGSRKELLKVKRVGPKAFEQSAGFLRIHGADNPLDASAVHPESYSIVAAMAEDLGCSVEDLMRDPALRKKIDPSRYVTDTVGLPTLTDILEELAQPGRDPRPGFEHFSFSDAVNSMEDLQPGMKLPGIVTNVTAFGAFVDVGVHQDGLVHISQLADRFVKDPSEVVKPRQRVNVTVLDVDLQRKRISLSMKSGSAKQERTAEPPRSKPGTLMEERLKQAMSKRNKGR